MASDLISKKALLERLEKIHGTDSIVDKIMLRFLKKLIRKQPTVDAVEVVHGEWIWWPDNDGCDYECSNPKCRCRISYNGAMVSGDFNYCPNCGAKMDEEVR